MTEILDSQLNSLVSAWPTDPSNNLVCDGCENNRGVLLMNSMHALSVSTRAGNKDWVAAVQ